MRCYSVFVLMRINVITNDSCSVSSGISVFLHCYIGLGNGLERIQNLKVYGQAYIH